MRWRGRQRDGSIGAMGGVLITGGAGFLGRHLAASIAARGVDVTVLNDLSGANASFDCPELAQRPRITCLKGTLRDETLVRSLVAAHEVVVHLASVVGVEETVSHTVATVRNLTSTLSLVGALTRDHVVLFASSADVYGAHSHLHDRPMREDDCFLYEHGLVNRWVYPHVKAIEENLPDRQQRRAVRDPSRLQQLRPRHGLPRQVLRYRMMVLKKRRRPCGRGAG